MINSGKTRQLWAASSTPPSRKKRGVSRLLRRQKSHLCQDPSRRRPPPQHPHLEALELPGPVVLGAFFVFRLLLQPLQPLGQQLLVQPGCVPIGLGRLQGLPQPLGLGRREDGTAQGGGGERGGARGVGGVRPLEKDFITGCQTP